MPSINETKNREHRRANYDRRSRAYSVLKTMAVKEGFMQNQRDTEGFDKYLDHLEKQAK